MNRQESNRKIIEILSNYIEDSPDIRFHQMLINLNVTLQDPILENGRMVGGVISRDQHNEESIETLKRIESEYHGRN